MKVAMKSETTKSVEAWPQGDSMLTIPSIWQKKIGTTMPVSRVP
jgi:hypothetical protein